MTDVRDQLAALASSAGKEVSRLARVESIDARDELRYRVWPLLAELIDTLQVEADDGELPGAVPVDLVARTVGLVLSMANRLGALLPAPEMERFAMAAAEITEELMALCDPDEMAAYIHDVTGNAPDPDATTGEAVIDTTLVEAQPAADAGEVIAEEHAAS